MEFPDLDEEPEHSPARYMISGGGCGCGCLGMLIILLASMALAAIPLQMYAEGPGNAGLWGVIGLTLGILTLTVGCGAYIFSLFIK